jgi:predicted Zn finger-like uncharacterized protein
MNLATRCPSCGTVFRVVRDQLKVSEGWVRCGRCAEVFNAAERLFELESGDIGKTPAAEETRAARVDPAVNEAVAPATEPVEAPPPAPAPMPEPEETASTKAAAVPEVPAVDPAETPEFMRRAERVARRRQPGPRVALALLAAFLAALLLAQIGMHYRDPLAAAWPATRPVLQAACGLLDCRVEAPRRIDSLHVDSSGLVRVQDSALYRLSLVVRNKAPAPARMPAVDLALTDAQGLTIARRMLSAADLGQPAQSLPAGGELLLQATLDLGDSRVAGYTVELFYP